MSKLNKIGISQCVVLLTAITIIAMVVGGWSIRQQDIYKRKMDLRDRDFEVRVGIEKKKIAQDLEEKYQADRISYEVMARQISQQQNNVRGK